jgi:hypothetical protein
MSRKNFTHYKNPLKQKKQLTHLKKSIPFWVNLTSMAHHSEYTVGEFEGRDICHIHELILIALYVGLLALDSKGIYRCLGPRRGFPRLTLLQRWNREWTWYCSTSRDNAHI